jgi:hypothetical protein
LRFIAEQSQQSQQSQLRVECALLRVLYYDGCALISVGGNIVAQGTQFSLRVGTHTSSPRTFFGSQYLLICTHMIL